MLEFIFMKHLVLVQLLLHKENNVLMSDWALHLNNPSDLR